MTNRPQDWVARVLAGVATASPLIAISAHAETSSGVGLGGSVEYVSNPFLLNTQDTAATRARVSIAPFIEERSARSSLRVSGDASFLAYSRRYKESVDLDTQVSYRNTLTRQLSVHAGLSLSSSSGGSYTAAPVLLDPLAPPVEPRLNDIANVGFQDRTTQASASAGLNYTINDRNSVYLDYDASVLRYPRAVNRSEYSSYGQTVGYSRVISPRVTAGASVRVSKVDYLGGPLGDATIISPSINGGLRINSRWRANGSVGFSTTRVTVFFGKLTSTNFNGNLSLCRSDTRTNLCLDAARATGASSIDGVRTTTTIGASYSYKLTPRDSFSASAGYSRAGSAVRALIPVGQTGTIDYFNASGSFSRQFARRLSGSVSTGYNRSTSLGARSSYYATIGVNYSFGNR